MVRTRLLLCACVAVVGLLSGCAGSRHSCGPQGCGDPCCERPSLCDRLRNLFRRDSTCCLPPCCAPCCDSCCETCFDCGPPCCGPSCCPSCGPSCPSCGPGCCAPNGMGFPAPPAGSLLPAPTPLPPQSAVPPLSAPPGTRIVPQPPQSQPQPYVPVNPTVMR